jgi:hypothetical protein
MNYYYRRFLSPRDRFMERVEMIPEAGCWIWTGPTDTRSTHLPYGRFWVAGTTAIAHRFAWQEFIGPIPQRMIVCHRCDVPYCVNPSHLFLGYPKDNTQDMMQKGRDARCRETRRGEKSNFSKLTQQQVQEIRVASGKQRDIAAQYGISQTCVSLIKRGVNWKHAC